jgi:hypothetical protein
MSHGDITDPVEAVGGVRKSPSVGATGPAQPVVHPSDSSQFLYQSNYVLQVMKYTNIAMEHQADIVSLRGEEAELGTKIASDLATISQFISTIQSKAHSGGELDAKFAGVWYASPETFSGLSQDFYNINQTDLWHFGSDSVGGVSASYQSMMTGFISAVKDLYFCSSTGVGPTVKDLSTITNPAGGQDFDMSKYFQQIQSSYSQYSNTGTPGLQVVSTNPSMHPSLLQQYMYAKAQLTVKTASADTLAGAGGDISKLVNFMNGSDGFDSDLQPFMQVLDSLNVQVSVKDNKSGTPVDLWIKGETNNVLSMILNGQLYNRYNGSDPMAMPLVQPEAGEVTPGLFCAFAYMAFNYIWTKNPNLDVDDQSASNNGTCCNSGIMGASEGWNYNNYTGVPQGDPLSALYANISSCQSNFSATGNATGTSFQQDVNSVQQVDGAAGKIADGYSQGQETLIRNFKS